MRYCTVLYRSCTLPHRLVLYFVKQHVPYRPYCVVPYFFMTVLCYTVLKYPVLYCTVLNRKILYKVLFLTRGYVEWWCCFVMQCCAFAPPLSLSVRGIQESSVKIKTLLKIVKGAVSSNRLVAVFSHVGSKRGGEGVCFCSIYVSIYTNYHSLNGFQLLV